MPTLPNTLDLPPFPPLTWDECEWWSGTIDLRLGAEADLYVTPYNAAISRMPENYQKAAIKFQIENGERVLESALKALHTYYNKMRPWYQGFLGETDFATKMPPLASASNLQTLITLRHVHVLNYKKDGVGYVGLEFDATWEQEHGLGIIMHLDRVVDIGSADVSFGNTPDEADNNPA